MTWDGTVSPGNTYLSANYNAMVAYVRWYEEVAAGTKQMVINKKYGANYATLVTFTLPVTAAIGDRVAVVSVGAGGWTIAQNASQLIHIGATVSLTGTGGSVASSNAFDCVELTCEIGRAHV